MERGEITKTIGKPVKASVGYGEPIDGWLMGYAYRIIKLGGEPIHQAEVMDKSGTIYVCRLSDVKAVEK